MAIAAIGTRRHAAPLELKRGDPHTGTGAHTCSFG